MNASELEAATRVAEHACDRARTEILSRFRKTGVSFKADGSPVTEADLAAERAIRDVLRQAYPDFGILGEEYGDETPDSPGHRPQWIVDPIDGTISFSRGIPLFGTLIALVEENEPIVGVIDLPALDDRYRAWRGGGCRRNGQPVRVSEASNLGTCIASMGDAICFRFSERTEALARMRAEIPLLRSYTDAFGHAMVLSGALDVMVDCDLNPWDAAATQLLAVEAGGACETRKNARDKLDLIFGSPALVEQILDFFE